jgi:hypothetical protein
MILSNQPTFDTIIQAARLSRKGCFCLDRKLRQNVLERGRFDPPPKIIDRGILIQMIKC